MVEVRRIVAVTCGLVATGSVVGALLGAPLFLAAVAATDGLRYEPSVVQDLAVGGQIGAVIGAVLAPALAWGLLRTVPLGRAIAETAAGTLLGALVFFVIPAFGPLLGGIAGFVAAGVRLRIRYARRAHALQSTGRPG